MLQREWHCMRLFPRKRCFPLPNPYLKSVTFISVAAVSDWRPTEVTKHKIKKTYAEQVIKLHPNPDILATLAADRRDNQTVIGFCAETEDLEAALLSLRPSVWIGLLVILWVRQVWVSNRRVMNFLSWTLGEGGMCWDLGQSSKLHKHSFI